MKVESAQVLKKASNVYAQLACLPSVSSARFRRTSDTSALVLETQWTQTEPRRRDRIIVAQDYVIGSPSDIGLPPKLVQTGSQHLISVGTGFPYSSSYKCLWDVKWNPHCKSDYSRSSRRAISVEFTLPPVALADTEAMRASAPAAGTFVHLYESGRLIKTIQLPPSNADKKSTADETLLHGPLLSSINNETPFTGCEFSPDGRKLVYLAEAVEPKIVTSNETASVKKLDPSPFLYRETWGESLSNITQPVLCTVNFESEEVECLHARLQKLLPESKQWCFDSPLWTPDSTGIVFLAYEKRPYPLGLIYCCQRASRLFYWNFETSEIKELSRPDRAVKWPTFSPDGSKLVWFEIPAGGPHCQCFELLAIEWPPKAATTVSIVVPLVTNSDQNTDFPGLFLSHGVPRHVWTSDSQALLVSSCWGFDLALLRVDLSKKGMTDRVVRLPSPLTGIDIIPHTSYGAINLFDVYKDFVVVAASSPVVPTFIAITKLPNEGNFSSLRWLTLCSGEVADAPPTILQGVKWETFQHVAEQPDPRFGVSQFESTLIEPDVLSPIQLTGVSNIETKSEASSSLLGVIVLPHGGPHSCFSNEWYGSIAAYVASGFACLLVNYRGSIGYGNANVHCLPGQIGSIDVADCVQATKVIQARFPGVPVLLMGGSHGGFLVLHLAARHPDLYHSVVARNPVTNLVSMIGTSDIPDWCWEEAGLGDTSSKIIYREHPEKSCRTWQMSSVPTSAEELLRLAKASPITYITSEWRVPLLMCLGAKDLRVPNSQGIAFVRTLRASLGDDRMDQMCATLRFPTEAHPIESPAAGKDNFIRIIEWFYKSLHLLA